jgi:hypothetical protein
MRYGKKKQEMSNEREIKKREIEKAKGIFSSQKNNTMELSPS